MPLQSLSAISGTELYHTIEHVRALINTTGSTDNLGRNNIHEIRELLSSPLNRNGEFYKYYFDREHEEDEYNPSGNNMLLLAIARGAFNPVDRDSIITSLVEVILYDAAAKLSAPHLQDFLSFRFVPAPAGPDLYYYDNTPLTLAVKAGMISIACDLLNLVEDPEDINAASYGGEGQYTALHLLALRLPLSRNWADLDCMQRALDHGANPHQLDSYGRTVVDIVNLHDTHLWNPNAAFSFKTEEAAVACGLSYREAYDAARDGDMPAKVRAYFLRELCAKPEFVAFYQTQTGQEHLPTGTEQARCAAFQSMSFLNRAVKVDVTKVLCSDMSNMRYDGTFDYGGAPYPCLSGMDTLPYRYDMFHGTDLHQAECALLGIEACPGGDVHLE